jgi:hypothetical protein
LKQVIDLAAAVRWLARHLAHRRQCGESSHDRPGRGNVARPSRAFDAQNTVSAISADMEKTSPLPAIDRDGRATI